LRVVFAGTPPFAARALEAILASGHDVPLVLSQPDRPAGRGMRLTASAVSELATALGIRVEKPLSLRTPQAAQLLREAAPDVIVVAAYGLLLPPEILAIPSRGCLNIHASLLPRWRGAAPIQYAILAGDATTGIGIMQMEAGLDTGPVLLEKAVAIGEHETTGTLTKSLSEIGAQAIVEALLSLDALVPVRQDESRATYAPKVARKDARIDWAQPSEKIERAVRAFDPVPGAETRLGAESLKVWGARRSEGRGRPGEVLRAQGEDLVIACGNGALALLEVQRAGAKRMAARDFLRGTAITTGVVLDAVPAG
jgi:methionyl-tRNA formyltransferase